MASTLLPSSDEAPLVAPTAAPLADAYRAVLEGLELLAAKTTPLPRHSALAGPRVLLDAGPGRGRAGRGWAAQLPLRALRGPGGGVGAPTRAALASAASFPRLRSLLAWLAERPALIYAGLAVAVAGPLLGRGLVLSVDL